MGSGWGRGPQGEDVGLPFWGDAGAAGCPAGLARPLLCAWGQTWGAPTGRAGEGTVGVNCLTWSRNLPSQGPKNMRAQRSRR